MATSETVVANMALSHLGTGKEIASLTENSEEANSIRRFSEEARKKVLEDCEWPFATKFAVLGLVEETPVENDEWGYSYRYPSDCLKPRRVLSGFRNDDRQKRIPYRIGRDDQGLLIYTDQQNANLEYTVNEDDYNIMPAGFTMALSFYIALRIAPRLTKGDPFKIMRDLEDQYMKEIGRAQANRFNAEQPDHPVESEFIRIRS